MRKSGIPVGLFFIVLLLLQSFGPMLQAQASAPTAEDRK
jgi:hypothetical protein